MIAARHRVDANHVHQPNDALSFRQRRKVRSMERISRVKCQDIGVAEFVFRKIKNSLVARISDLTLLNVVYRTTVDIVRMEDDERSASLGKYKCRRKHHDYQSNDNGDNRQFLKSLHAVLLFIRESICFDISILPQFMTNAQIHHVNSPQIQCKQYLNNFNRYTYSTIESRTNYHKMQR